MRPPIFADDNGDLSVFPSAAAAESYLEAVDVKDGAYRFFDADGLVMEGVTSDRVGGWPFRTRELENQWTLVESVPLEHEAHELASAIRRHLKAIKPEMLQRSPDWIETAGLRQLVAEAARFWAGGGH